MERVKRILWALFATWFALGFLWNLAHARFHSVEGEPCGPHHHWTWIGGPDYLGDLSCEEDAR